MFDLLYIDCNYHVIVLLSLISYTSPHLFETCYDIQYQQIYSDPLRLFRQVLIGDR